MFLDWWRLRCGGRHPRGEPCVRGASKVFHRWSHRKSKFDEKYVTSTFLRSLTDHYFQLHLFKCSKEVELSNLIKKHIYFVKNSPRRIPLDFCKYLFSLCKRRVAGWPVSSTVQSCQRDLISNSQESEKLHNFASFPFSSLSTDMQDQAGTPLIDTEDKVKRMT